MYSICVLMSTYNGEKYLQKQIDSILQQKGVNLTLCIRDDGSSDNTLNLLEGYSISDSRIKVIKGKNCGVTSSFMSLVQNSPNADYYSFADQDDIWDSDKLEIAASELSRFSGTPSMYYCNYRQIDGNDEIIVSRAERYLAELSLEKVILTNNCTGCTVVINHAMRKKLCDFIPPEIMMHDHWVYLLCKSIGGSIICDSNPHMSYRQHDNNVLGAKISLKKKVEMSTFGRSRCIRSTCVNYIYKHYFDDLGDNRKLITTVATYKKYGNRFASYKLLKPYETTLKRKLILAISISIGAF